jgi:hypothetical protein
MLLATLLGATPASARAESGAIVLSGGLGILMPRLTSNLGTSFQGSLEAGYAWPWLEGRLETYSAIGYTQPHHSGTGTDSRLVGEQGAYQFTTLRHELTLDLGLRCRVFPLDASLNLFGALGPRAAFLLTETSSRTGGISLGTTSEKSLQGGLFAAIGGELMLGPGRITLQLTYGQTPADHLITGDVSAGALCVSAGYRLIF